MVEKKLIVINPEKCVIDNYEILSFDNEDELNYFTIWHDSLIEKRKGPTNTGNSKSGPGTSQSSNHSHQHHSRQHHSATTRANLSGSSTSSSSASKLLSRTSQLTASQSRSGLISRTPAQSRTGGTHLQRRVGHPAASTSSLRTRGHLVSSQASNIPIIKSTLDKGLQLLKYKLNKIYNKYRGRQLRGKFVYDKQLRSRIDTQIDNSILTPWLTYVALQALDVDYNTNNSNKNNNSYNSKQKNYNQNYNSQATILATPNPFLGSHLPMHIFYIDPSRIITYNNGIRPRQVADYRQRTDLIPLASSKKSSAASYDAYELMDVLANSNKTHVVITRNSHRNSANSATQNQNQNSNQQPESQTKQPQQQPQNQPPATRQPVYTCSVNQNNPEIVSTQLHIQAKWYQKSLRTCYADLKQEIENEMNTRVSEDHLIDNYLNRFKIPT